MQKFQFVTTDTILAKYSRDFRGLDINVDDAVEWIGEALGFIKIASASEEAIAFLKVENYQVEIPKGLHYIVQIARKNNNSLDIGVIEENLGVAETTENNVEDVPSFTRYLNFPFKYVSWASNAYASQEFTQVTLADSSFFNSLVCEIPGTEGLYTGHSDEYTIAQDNLRFNFKEGFVAISYIRQMVDCVTGYPMVPDDESAKSAITYYLGWKFKENECWNHREGSCQLAEKAEGKWLKYVKQFKNKAKMPQGVDQYQNLMEQHTYLVPNRNKYYGFFGRVKDKYTR
jgi:hypothetical protein